MTDLTMSQFASKDDLLAAQAARIAELESQLEAIGAGGVEPLRKPVAEPQECARSHPHEEMTPMCELRTEIARLTNALARAEAAAPQAVQAAVPEGWKLAPIKVPDSAFAWVSGGYPAGFKAGDKRDTAVVHERAQRTWEAILNGITAPAHPAEGVPAQAVQAAVPDAIEQMAVDRYKVVPSHESMFHRWAVVAGNGTQQLYIGREVECQNMALKFAGAFLDGAFVAMQNTAPAYPAEGVTAQAVYAEARECSHCNHVGLNDSADDIATCNECQWSGDSPKEDKCPACQAEGTMTASCPKCHHGYRLLADATLAATQPAAQGMDAQQYRLIERGELIEAGDQFLRDDFTWQIDPQGIFVGMPHGAGLRPARRAIAAQAKQGGA